MSTTTEKNYTNDYGTDNGRNEPDSLGNVSDTTSSSFPPSLDPGAQIEMSATVNSVVPDDTFTVDQAVNALGFGKFQPKIMLLGGYTLMPINMLETAMQIRAPPCRWRFPAMCVSPATSDLQPGLNFSRVL
ncbi:unnamed protein product, partial [Meganyctiphanes norvegica]